MTERNTDRRLWVASETAESELEERALLGSILQYIRTRVILARDLAHEMERRRPAPAPKPGRVTRSPRRESQ